MLGMLKSVAGTEWMSDLRTAGAPRIVLEHDVSGCFFGVEDDLR